MLRTIKHNTYSLFHPFNATEGNYLVTRERSSANLPLLLKIHCLDLLHRHFRASFGETEKC